MLHIIMWIIWLAHDGDDKLFEMEKNLFDVMHWKSNFPNKSCLFICIWWTVFQTTHKFNNKKNTENVYVKLYELVLKYTHITNTQTLLDLYMAEHRNTHSGHTAQMHTHGHKRTHTGANMNAPICIHIFTSWCTHIYRQTFWLDTIKEISVVRSMLALLDTWHSILRWNSQKLKRIFDTIWMASPQFHRRLSLPEVE